MREGIIEKLVVIALFAVLVLAVPIYAQEEHGDLTQIKECKPICKAIGTRSEGWYDSCTGKLIEYAKCSSMQPPQPPENINLTLCPSHRLKICPSLYEPVCAKIVTSAGQTIWKTEPNYCVACLNQDVIGYIKGKCKEEQNSLKVPRIVKREVIVREIKKRFGAITPTQIREKVREGEVKLNLTPHLKAIAVFPSISCPAFMKVKLNYEAHVGRAYGYVISYLHRSNLTLPKLCENKTEIEAIVREAVEQINLSKVCSGLERESENCKKIENFNCERIKNATKRCLQGLRKCKLAKENISRKAWKEQIEEKLREWKAHQKAVDELLEENESEVEYSEKNESEEIEIPKIEGVIPKCYVEEKVCENLEEKYEKCLDFREKCVDRCDVINDLAEKCKKDIVDKDKLVDRLVDIIEKRCELINYLPPIKKVENESIAKAEIQPVIIVTDPLTSEQEGKIKEIVEKIRKVFSGNDTWIYKAFVRANKIEDLRELEFVREVKLDHITRAVQKGAFKKLANLPEFVPKKEEILPYLEGVKEKIDPELQPVVTDTEEKILKHSENLTKHVNEEKARGFGYGILKFLGLQATREKKDAELLERSAMALNKSVERLKEVAEAEEDPEVKATILEQVTKLQESINATIAKAREKRRGAFGIWSLLGLGR